MASKRKAARISQSDANGTSARLLEFAKGILGPIEQAWPQFGPWFHQITALREAASHVGMLHQDFPALSRECDTFGNEHEVWFPSGSQRVWKATYPNTFGIAPGREGEATPFEYLERMVLCHVLFGDDWDLEGVWSLDDSRIRLVSSQSFVRGDPATPEEIRSLFESFGFVGIRRRGAVSGTDAIDWVHAEEGIVVRDAHGENILRTAAGQLVAIDLAVGRLS